MLDNWKWMVGTINGYGECAWEQCGDRIRKITIVMANQNGAMAMFIPVSLRFMEGKANEIEFSAQGVVSVSRPLTEKVVQDFERLWSGSKLVLVDAAGMGPGGVRR